MKGYPKNLNTITDYEYVRQNFDADVWLPDWQKLLDTMEDWVPTGTLESEDAGVTDDTHKVTGEKSDDGGETTWTQWELQEIPTCKLYRIGFTEEYVKSVIAAAEAEG